MDSLAGPLILIVCLVIGLLTFRRAFIRRADFARVRRGPLYGGTGSRPPGSAGKIADAGLVPAQELLGALQVRGAPEVDADGEDDGVSGLGLKLHRGSAVNQLAQVMEGSRNGHQVFIRQGLVGNSVSPGLGLRRSRTITVVRALAPPFEARLDAGRVEPGKEAPQPVRHFLARLAVSPDVWHDGRLVAGAEGMVISRGAGDDWLGGWIYDLWLLEGLALEVHASALGRVPLDRFWEAPYGLHSWAPRALATADPR